MNQAINALKTAGGWVAKMYKPGPKGLSDAFATGTKALKEGLGAAGTEGARAKMHSLSLGGMTMLGRGAGDYLLAADYAGEGLERTRAAAGLTRMLSTGAAIQGTSRIIHGNTPFEDERGVDMPGLPWI